MSLRRSFVLALPVLAACGATAAPVTSPVPAASSVAPIASSASAAIVAKPAYPAAPKTPVVDAYGALRVTDDYRWLEDAADPKVQAWSDAEKALTRSVLDAEPRRAKIRERLAVLMGEEPASWNGLVAAKNVLFAMERRPPKEQPYLVVLASLESLEKERVLVDPSALDASGGTSIGWFVPSVDGARVAVALAKGGAEHGDVHVYDVATGKEAKDVVPQAEGAGAGNCLAWKADASGFYYTHAAREEGVAKDGVHQRIYFHKLGDAVEKDVLAVGKDSPRIAQWELRTAEDGRTIVARMEVGDSDQWEQWLLPTSGAWTRVATIADGVKDMRVGPGGALYLLSSKGAPKHAVLRTSLATPSLAKAEIVVPEGDGVIDALIVGKTRLYLVESVGGPARLRSVPIATPKANAALIATPPLSAISAITSLGGDDVAIQSESFTAPTAWYRVSGKDGAVTKTALARTSSADFSNVETDREVCVSKDGTKVPLTILHAKDLPRNGENPALLWGYGGFGIDIAPWFSAQRLAFIEQGGAYAIANLRGGGELGETWHEDGRLLHKQNTFDDLYACALRLGEAKYTRKERLAIEGGSNGGLLMGAEITQHPDAFAAVVSHVGMYDMLRLERDPNGAFNVSEYGSVSDPAMLAALFAYSPYHHVTDGAAYPATLFLTGANDPRVAPYHSRKMVARMQAATASAAPILLRTSASTGHGIGTPLTAAIDERADVYAFVFSRLGIATAR